MSTSNLERTAGTHGAAPNGDPVRNGHRRPLAVVGPQPRAERAGQLSWDGNGNVTAASPRLRELIGCGVEDLRGRSWTSLFAGIPRSSEPPGVGEEWDAHILHWDGSAPPVLLIGAEHVPGGGRRLFVIAQDVTDLELAKQALARSERRLAEAQQMANVGSWEMEVATGAVTWTDHLFRVYGLDPATAAASYEAFKDVLHPEDRDEVIRRIDEGFACGVSVEYDYRIVRPDGVERRMHSRNDVVLDGTGKPERLIGSVQDVTEWREAEMALSESEARLLHAQKMEAVGRLAGGVAHDFNNLLTAILGYAQLAARHLEAGNPARNDLDEIRKAGERAAALTRQLLAFSRKQVLEPRQLQLRTLIVDLEPMLRRLIGEDVVLATTLDDGEASVFADRGQIEQVIMNLVLNARDAMPDGGIITLSTRATTIDAEGAKRLALTEGRYVELAVVDTGTGMTPEVFAHLFEPFFTTKETGKGTGLGLATAYGIVKQSGGEIEVESQPGSGSRFRILLPLTDTVGDLTAAPEIEGVLRGDETILLVEDEPQVRAVTRQILELAGYQVLEASNGQEAQRAAREFEGTIHLMLTDVMMPGLSGREVADRVTLERPVMRVLYVSGYTNDAVVLRTVLASGVPFLHKPFSHEALMRKVREVLDRRG